MKALERVRFSLPMMVGGRGRWVGWGPKHIFEQGDHIFRRLLYCGVSPCSSPRLWKTLVHAQRPGVSRHSGERRQRAELWVWVQWSGDQGSATKLVLPNQNIMQAMYVIFHSGAAIFKKMKRNRGI